MSALLLMVALMPLGAADDTPMWLQTGRISNLNEEPLKFSNCPLGQDDDFCGRSQADFGSELALDGDWAFIGEPNAGSVHVYSRGLEWVHEATFTGSEGFGDLVTLHEDVALVGEPSGGVVHVIELKDGTWTETQVLTSETGTCFARALDLFEQQIAVGDLCTSKVHFFEKTTDGWVESEVLEIDGVPFLGHTVAIAGDSILAGSGYGTHAFEKDSNGWKATFVSPTAAHLTASGNVFATISSSEVPTGAVHVYERQEEEWHPVAVLEPHNASPFEGWERFGRSLDLEGRTIVAGATEGDPLPGEPPLGDTIPDECPSDDLCVPPRPGTAYVFDGSGGEWVQSAKLTGDLVGEHEFARAASISSDENTIMVSSPRNLLWSFGGSTDLDPEDSVHVFSRVTMEV